MVTWIVFGIGGGMIALIIGMCTLVPKTIGTT